ncbi:MAG: DUF4878 domain-containing protein [Clostridia bacterium]|nr:DUF4878 domain-containing protein [Clostridia bacterium]
MKKVLPKILPIVFVFCLLLTACGSPTPDKTVLNFLDAAKSIDTETMSKYVVDGKDSYKNVENEIKEDYISNYIKSANSKMKYSIEKSEIKDNTATITVKCKFIDSTDLMKDVMGEYFTKAIGQAFTSDDEVDVDKILKDVFIEKSKEAKDKFTEKTIKITCVKSEDAWLIKEISDDLANVITANILIAGKELNEDHEAEADTPENKLYDIQNWLVGDIWNDGFCNISHYIEDGTDYIGGTLDIDATVSELTKSMKAKADYDKFINDLDDSKYADVKSLWNKLSPEIDKLYNTVTTKKPVAKDSSYTFDTDLFQQYRQDFDDAVSEL